MTEKMRSSGDCSGCEERRDEVVYLRIYKCNSRNNNKIHFTRIWGRDGI